MLERLELVGEERLERGSAPWTFARAAVRAIDLTGEDADERGGERYP